MKTFRPHQPDQLPPLPASIQEWLPEHHPARFVSEVLDELDLSVIEERYNEEPRRSRCPRLGENDRLTPTAGASG